jgi:hypothetical protein
LIEVIKVKCTQRTLETKRGNSGLYDESTFVIDFPDEDNTILSRVLEKLTDFLHEDHFSLCAKPVENLNGIISINVQSQHHDNFTAK